MKIKLKKDINQNGQIKTTVRPNRKKVIGWFEGTVMEVSDATGQKMIDADEAELVVEEAAAEVTE